MCPSWPQGWFGWSAGFEALEAGDRGGDLLGPGPPGGEAELEAAAAGRCARWPADLVGDGGPGGESKPSARLRHPGQEVLGVAAGVSADQDPAAQVAGSCASPSRVGSMWSAAVFEPAFPASA